MASDVVKEKMTQARDLIQAKRYDEARAVLVTVDHPTAQEWLTKLDQIAPAAFVQPKAALNSTAQTPASTRPRLPFLGLILLILFTIAGGIGAGVLLAITARYIYLIFASIIIAAAVGGAILLVAVRAGKVRSGAAAFLFGAIMGLLIYGSYRYVEYVDNRDLFRQELYAQDPKADPQLIEEIIDEVLVEETGSDGFVGFTLLQAQEGMTVTRASSTSDSGGFTLSRELTMGYWVIEVLIAMGVPIAFALGQTNQPFCEDDNKWLKYQKIGQVPKESIDAFMNALQRNDFQQAGSLIEAQGGRQLPKLTVETGRCNDGSRDGRIKVTAQHAGRNNTKELVNTVISADQFNSLPRK